jgi:tRNA(adenine34) deaminase
MIDEKIKSDSEWMAVALEMACRAESMGEVPVGAIVVRNNTVIGEGFNQPIISHNPAGHAEVIALQDAANRLKNYRTVDTTLFVTLEPCPMCAGLMLHARVKRLVFGAYDQKSGAAGSVLNLLQHPKLNHQIDITGGVRAEECGQLLSRFFKRRRAEQKAAKLQNQIEKH